MKIKSCLPFLSLGFLIPISESRAALLAHYKFDEAAMAIHRH